LALVGLAGLWQPDRPASVGFLAYLLAALAALVIVPCWSTDFMPANSCVYPGTQRSALRWGFAAKISR